MPKSIIVAGLVLAFGLSAGSVAQAADAEKLFKFYCVQCHGLDGKGDGPNVTEDFATNPRDFTDAEEMNKLSDADLMNVILDGGPSVSKSALMPPWGKTLTDEDVDVLIKKLRQLCNCEGKKG